MALEQIQSTFKVAIKTHIFFLGLTGIITSIVLGYSWSLNFITSSMVLQVLLFFIISFLENISLTYEQLFIAQHRAKILAQINILELSLLAPIIYSGMLINNNIFIYTVSFHHK